MECQIGGLVQECQKYKIQQKHTHTHTHTHITHANTQNRKESQLHKLFKKAHMSHQYLFPF